MACQATPRLRPELRRASVTDQRPIALEMNYFLDRLGLQLRIKYGGLAAIESLAGYEPGVGSSNLSGRAIFVRDGEPVPTTCAASVGSRRDFRRLSASPEPRYRPFRDSLRLMLETRPRPPGAPARRGSQIARLEPRGGDCPNSPGFVPQCHHPHRRSSRAGTLRPAGSGSPVTHDHVGGADHWPRRGGPAEMAARARAPRQLPATCPASSPPRSAGWP
jgi:hypothetical protein